ncbi:high-affinity iron permease [Vanrija albida]|uniref:High-affinity iron permease n=1 Tax=Vanrija albida TaxID=181172 RepID=A0ABR3QED9_9TREE
MAKDVFYVPIFFIVFRETIEAAIIVSVLLSFVEQLMTSGRLSPNETDEHAFGDHDQEHNAQVKTLIKRMRWQIWAGTLTGLAIALVIGAAFIAVFYTKLNDLWGKTEQIWEGVFCLIACILILIMGLAFLKMDRSRIKWRYKLAAAFSQSSKKMLRNRNANAEDGTVDETVNLTAEDKRESRSSKWALFLLPFITVLREGLEAVVFVGGVSLNAKATSIPLPVVVGLIAGFIVGYLIYRTGSTATLHWFLIISTTILFLIGAGLASRGVGFLQYYVFAKGVGGDVAETGDGPGSYQVAGNVFHLTYGNPESGSPTTNGGWQIFNALFGWNNTATLGTILIYVFYWLVVIAALVYNKWNEGRFTFFGRGSQAYNRRLARREAKARDAELAAQATTPLDEKKGHHDGSDAGSSSGTAPHQLDNRSKEHVPTI